MQSQSTLMSRTLYPTGGDMNRSPIEYTLLPVVGKVGVACEVIDLEEADGNWENERPRQPNHNDNQPKSQPNLLALV